MSDETRDRHFTVAGSTLKLEEGNQAAQGSPPAGPSAAGPARRWRRCLRWRLDCRAGCRVGDCRTYRRGAGWSGRGRRDGGIIGALVGAGIPEDRAMVYERGLDEGGVVVGARACDGGHAAELNGTSRATGPASPVAHALCRRLASRRAADRHRRLVRPGSRRLRLVAQAVTPVWIAGRRAGRGSRSPRSRPARRRTSACALAGLAITLPAMDSQSGACPPTPSCPRPRILAMPASISMPPRR